MITIPKPQAGDYAPYTADYIERVPDDGQVLRHLRENLPATLAFVRSFPPEKLGWAHQPGEWTIKEIMVHLSDSERVFAYRALRFARGDETELIGFNQNDYVPTSQANDRDIEDILAEFSAVRMATLALFEGFREEAIRRTGKASGKPMSVGAAAYIIAGHELHHVASIRENYL